MDLIHSPIRRLRRLWTISRTSLDLPQKGLSPEFIERIDYVVELIGFDSREELVRCAVRRYVDTYFPIGKYIFHKSYDPLEEGENHE